MGNDPITPDFTELDTKGADIPEPEKYVDVDDALSRIRGNRKLYKTLLQSFMNHSRFDTLEDDIERNDLEAAVMTAHTIKGTSANLSLKKMYETVTKLEAEAKAGAIQQETLQACRDSYAKTKAIIEDLLAKF